MRKNDRKNRTCSYRVNDTCPLYGKCLSSNIVYFLYSAEALIDNNQQADKYFGICKAKFKTRLGNHKILGNHKTHLKTDKKEKDTELSKYL